MPMALEIPTRAMVQSLQIYSQRVIRFKITIQLIPFIFVSILLSAIQRVPVIAF